MGSWLIGVVQYSIVKWPVVFFVVEKAWRVVVIMRIGMVGDGRLRMGGIVMGEVREEV